MHAWTRPKEPEELRKARPKLTREFVLERRRSGKNPVKFIWPKIKCANGGEETLQEYLARSTERHCNYCDSSLGYSARKTIDHFLPKSKPKFACLAYVWSNLYLCCDGCQRKGTKFDKSALRPDEVDADGKHYEFSRYFRYKLDGTINIIATNEADRKRAETTIEVLGLDDPKLEHDRRLVFNAGLMPRMRPLPLGLSDPKTALLRHKMLQQDYSSKPFRDFFTQSHE